MIIEWNAHIFSTDTDRYPFHERAAYEPREEMRFDDPLGDYISRMEEEGIDRAVLFIPSRTETTTGLRLIASLLGLICSRRQPCSIQKMMLRRLS